MSFDVRTLATISYGIQIVLIGLMVWAAFLARKRRLVTHCTVMRVAGGVLLVSIFAVMLPAMLGYLRTAPPGLSAAEVLVHHSLGSVVVLLWVFINLAVAGAVKVRHRLAPYMWTALGSWLVTFVLGAHMYFLVYV